METCPECGGHRQVLDGDGELEDCEFCVGSGTIDPPESDLDQWDRDVDRGIQAHRERFLD